MKSSGGITTITGEGSFSISRIETAGTGDLEFDDFHATATTLDLFGGDIIGSGSLTVPGTVTWNKGAVACTLNTTGTLLLDGIDDTAMSLTGTLNNEGTATWLNGNLNGSAPFFNLGTLDVKTDARPSQIRDTST